MQARITVSYKPSATEREELHGAWMTVPVSSSNTMSNPSNANATHTIVRSDQSQQPYDRSTPTESAAATRTGLDLLADVTEKSQPSRVICHPIELARLHAIPDSRVWVHPGV